ncbi:hypothetical protein [Streptomyces canus]|uniref:hypothetical protein n=1 Tax=Streptomyces canus TaxID=58343 RepID=UPI002DDAF6AE|nr:hypothetical protein [Streptomyces canus]WSD92715.1 hypothetical protein OG925_51605 [Streptomyces canus]
MDHVAGPDVAVTGAGRLTLRSRRTSFAGQWQHNRTCVLDEYKPYLDERWDEGCTKVLKLWEEIVPLGHRGSYGRLSGPQRAQPSSELGSVDWQPTPPSSSVDLHGHLPGWLERAHPGG